MNQVLCEMCGLHNRPEAESCARCKEPLEVKTRITISPFAEAASRTTQKTVVAHSEDLQPPRRSTQEVTRVVPGPLDVPDEARQEPQFAPRGRPKAAPAAPPVPVPEGLPAIRSRIPTQPLTNDTLRTQPGRSQRAITADLQQTTPVGSRPNRAAAPAPAPPEQQGLTAEYTSPAELPRTVLMELDLPSREQLAPNAPIVPKATLRDRLAAAANAVMPTTVDTPPEAPHVQAHLTRASWHHHLAANAIDAAVALMLVLAIACMHVTLGRHGYPDSRPTAFENLGLWLARSGSQPWRTALTAVVVLTAYGAWGALKGATLGRMVMGLVLVSQEGRPVGLGGALWHGLGCGLNILTLGAGTLWFVVDRWHRSWASLLSRTQVVPRHQVVPR